MRLGYGTPQSPPPLQITSHLHFPTMNRCRYTFVMCGSQPPKGFLITGENAVCPRPIPKELVEKYIFLFQCNFVGVIKTPKHPLLKNAYKIGKLIQSQIQITSLIHKWCNDQKVKGNILTACCFYLVCWDILMLLYHFLLETAFFTSHFHSLTMVLGETRWYRYIFIKTRWVFCKLKSIKCIKPFGIRCVP